MLTDKLIGQLRQIVGTDHVAVSRTDAEVYSYDASLDKGLPAVVLFPGTTAEVSDTVAALHRAGIVFIPRGFGTNLSGGTIPAAGSAVICLSRLNRILAIHPRRRCAVVQPGVTNLELQQALAPLGFFYAPDPASQKVATIGGNIGENSGGPRCLKYGVTTNHILGLEAVLATGEVIRLGGAALDPPGYDLRGLLIGSEGTLALATEITVRILPRPAAVITMLAVYDDIADAARSVSAVISAGIVPTTLEMMDAPIIKAVEDSHACGYPRDAAAVLIIEVEGPPAGLEDQAARIRQLCRQNNCREVQDAQNAAERDRLWEGRRGAFGAIARLAPSYLVNDCTVPRTQLPEALARVAAIAEKYHFLHGNVFHAGDGNLHPLLLFDARNADQLRRVEKAGWEIMQACVKLGGTITGEHGVGLEKLEAMRMLFADADLAVQHGIKNVWDPDNLLNPGKAIPPLKKPLAAKSAAISNSEMPGRPAALQSLLADIGKAAAAKKALNPMGHGMHSDFGNLLAADISRLSAAALDKIIDLDSPNQVVSAGAGMTLKKLQAMLEDHGQWLPLRPPFAPARISLGALAALGACGPERLQYGAPRDLILGLRFIDANGRLITTGGRVVKNVAGYDLTRLMVGSAGTLGLITAITWRIAMLPERCSTATAEGDLETCARAALAIITSDLLPVFIAGVAQPPPDGHSDRNRWKIAVGYEGFAGTVEYQLEKTGAFLEKQRLKFSGRQDYSAQTGVFNPYLAEIEPAAFVLRTDVTPDRVAQFAAALASRFGAQKIFLDFGCGRILAALSDVSDAHWEQMCHLARGCGGHCLLEKAPVAFKKRHDVFGLPRPAWKMMHGIKAALDPQNIFAPGRLPGKK